MEKLSNALKYRCWSTVEVMFDLGMTVRFKVEICIKKAIKASKCLLG